MSIHDLFLRFHSLFGDMHILEIQSSLFTHLSNFACTFCKMVQHISGNTYHITDIGKVNNITVTYWEYPYNGFDTLRNKTCRILSSGGLLIYLRNYNLDCNVEVFVFGNCVRLKLHNQS